MVRNRIQRLAVFLEKIKAAYFYFERLLRSFFPGNHVFDELLTGELGFQRLAIQGLKDQEAVVDAGPRVDTFLAELASSRGLPSYLIEANPRFAKRLRKKVRNYPKVQVVNHGIADGERHLEYYLLTQSFDPSLGFPNLGLKRRIKCKPLDQLLSKEVQVGFLKTDLEGFDYGALVGAQRILCQLSFLQFEFATSWEGRSLTIADYAALAPGMALFLLRDESNPFFASTSNLNLVRYSEDMWTEILRLTELGYGFNIGMIREGLLETLNID